MYSAILWAFQLTQRESLTNSMSGASKLALSHKIMANVACIQTINVKNTLPLAWPALALYPLLIHNQ